MNHCPTTQIVLCKKDKGGQCTMYCPTTSMVFADAVQLALMGSSSTGGFSNEIATSKGVAQQQSEGYCVDSEGNPSKC